jgi:flagellar biosynthesis protein FlhB
MVRFKERKGQKESSDKMKLSNRILVLFCCCVCFICVGSIVAEKATVNAVEYVLRPYISFMRDIIGGQEQMGNILLGLGLMFLGIFVYCTVAVIVLQLLAVLFKALLSLWRNHNSVNPVNGTQTERDAS